MRFLRDEEGATAVEYGIMVAAIAAVINGIVIAVGQRPTRLSRPLRRRWVPFPVQVPDTRIPA